MAEYDTRRTGGLIAINLDEGDDLIGVRLTQGGEDIIWVPGGKASGLPRMTSAVQARLPGGKATLDEGDVVVGMERVQPDADLLVVTDHGFGKRTPVDQYPVQRRAGKGVINIRLTERVGKSLASRWLNRE